MRNLQPKAVKFVACGSAKDCVPVLIGSQALEQSAAGSVNGDNAAQPAANAVAGVDSSASAHAIQVCTT